MRAIPGILMLLVVSGVSANASASKFDFNSALSSVLKTVLDTRQPENKVSYKDYERVVVEELYGDDYEDVDREIPLDSKGRPLYDSDIREHDKRIRDRIEENRRRTQKAAVYACDLDTKPTIEEVRAINKARDIEEGHAVNYAMHSASGVGEYYNYYSDKYYSDESKCEQRREIIKNKTQEKNRQEQAKRIAEFSKLPEPKIGMTKDQVKKGRWGNPLIIELETDAQGKYEKWHYNHTKVLHFKNGKVTKIMNTKGGF